MRQLNTMSGSNSWRVAGNSAEPMHPRCARSQSATCLFALCAPGSTARFPRAGSRRSGARQPPSLSLAALIAQPLPALGRISDLSSPSSPEDYAVCSQTACEPAALALEKGVPITGIREEPGIPLDLGASRRLPNPHHVRKPPECAGFFVSLGPPPKLGLGGGPRR